MYKRLALILSIFLTFSCVTGCGPKKTEQKKTEMETEPAAPAYAFELGIEPLQLQGSQLQVFGFAGRNNTAYLDAEVLRNEERTRGVYRLDLDSGKTEAVALPQEQDMDSSTVAMAVGTDDSLWLLRRKSRTCWELPEGMSREDPDALQYQTMEDLGLSLCHLDGAGTVLEEVPLELPEGLYVRRLVMDGQDRFYFNDYENVYVLDSRNFEMKQLPIQGISELVQLGPDTVGVRMQPDAEGTCMLYVLDADAGTVGKALPVPETVWRFYPGMDGYDFLYLDGQSVMGASVDGEWKPERLFSWLDCNINPDTFRDFVIREDGSIVGLEGGGQMTPEDQNRYMLATLTPVDPAALPQVQELTLACVGLDFNFKPMIVNFNRTHSDVRIVVKDYSEAGESGMEAGFARLTTEMMAGTLPDLLLTRGMPMEQLGATGFLEDLWPFLERDGGRDRLMTHVLDVMSQDGRLYYLTDGFAIMTATCDKAHTGGRTSWTLTEVLEALETLQPDADVFSESITKQNVLTMLLNQGLNGLVDWETGTCSFDGPRFLEMLQFTKRFPLEFDWEHHDYQDQPDDLVRMREGKQLMHPCILENMQEYVQELSLYEDGQAAFIGFPTDSGSGSSFLINAGLAMTTACRDKDAAWDFMAMLLEELPMMQASIPINRAVFDEQLRQLMTPTYMEDPETGEQAEKPKGQSRYGDHAAIYAMTQEEYALFLEVYESCQTLNTYHTDISELVMEEAAACFAGQKTAEETARLVQNRVSLYLQEQIG